MWAVGVGGGVGVGVGLGVGVSTGVRSGSSLRRVRSSPDSSSEREGRDELSSLFRSRKGLRWGVAGIGVGLGVGVGLGRISICCRLFKNSCLRRCSSSGDWPDERQVNIEHPSARTKQTRRNSRLWFRPLYRYKRNSSVGYENRWKATCHSVTLTGLLL